MVGGTLALPMGPLDIARCYGAKIFHIPQKEFTYGRSLNLGCQSAEGRYLVFVSGHVWPVTNNWLSNLIKPFAEPSVAMAYGRQRGTDASRLAEKRDLDTYYGPASSILVNEPRGNNGNAAIRRDLWLGQPFDETLPGLEDVDWVSKVQRKGYRVYYGPLTAVVYHLHEESLKQLYRRHLREATAYKAMFPSYKVAWTKAARGLAYLVVTDTLHALRERQLGKIVQIPGSRMVEMLGSYRGARYQKTVKLRGGQPLEGTGVELERCHRSTRPSLPPAEGNTPVEAGRSAHSSGLRGSLCD